jgi:hypothetical protein
MCGAGLREWCRGRDGRRVRNHPDRVELAQRVLGRATRRVAFPPHYEEGVRAAAYFESRWRDFKEGTGEEPSAEDDLYWLFHPATHAPLEETRAHVPRRSERLTVCGMPIRSDWLLRDGDIQCIRASCGVCRRAFG